MPNTRTYSRSFGGGEISPEMYGRIDDAQFQTGAATVRNFLVNPTGAVMNRAGFAYVNSTKNSGVARIIPFTYSLLQTMVVELGDQYARFHTMGETLQYDAAALSAWIPPSGDITYTLTTPAVITWANHGLSNGDPIRFYVYGTGTSDPLPSGLQLGYTYTVAVIDANTFTLIDQNGNAVGFSGGTGGGTSTNYPGAGTASATVSLAPLQSGNETSAAIGGLANTPVAGGVATLNVNFTVGVYAAQGVVTADFQYNAGGGWQTFYSTSAKTAGSVSVSIPITNLDQLQLQVYVQGFAGPSGSVYIDATINSWSVDVPSSAAGGTASLRAYYYYTAGDMVTYGGNAWLAVATDSGGTTQPGTAAAVWYELPADGTYEIPTPYAAADLFGIHYAQSADVMTLVHPNYPPSELRRLGATSWTLIPIVFGPPLAAPLGVTATASPGYKAQIQSISTADPALITTVSNHTLAMGDGIYIANLTATINGVATVLDGFYMVANVPANSSGNLIPNELTVMDYSGNMLDSSTWSGYAATDSTQPITIQYGTKIFNITNPYAVQAIASDGVSTSALSASASVLNNLDVPGSYNTIAWDAVDGAQSYNVYKQFNGLWGYIGNTSSLSFVDDNIAPDMSITPGIPDAVFSGAGNYPGAVCYFQQRRCFAGTINGPSNAWMSNSGTESMFSYSLPSLSTDRIAFRVAALKAGTIQHLVPMLQLIMLTSEAEYALIPGGSTAITPTSISVDPQSYVGSAGVQPTIINTTMVYVAARGGHIREMGYAWTVNGYMTGDLSLRAAHLFDTLTIVDQAYSKAPWPIVWFVSSNGDLLGLTYIPEQEIGSWHHHDTQGSFESICCVSEGSEDVLYAVINRTINGQTVRYVERMASRVMAYTPNPDAPGMPVPIAPEDMFFVDAGISQTFANPVTQLSGLTWLEGATVAVLADGGVQSQKVVTNGAITLDHAASVIQVGLPYVSDLFTLPAVMQVDGFGQGRVKNINKAWVKVYQSSGILVGPDANHLTEIAQRTTEPWGSPPTLQTAELLVITTPSWQENGQVLIRQQHPLPLDVVGLTLEVSIGG